MKPKNRKNRDLATLTGGHAALARACKIKGSQAALADAIAKIRGVPCSQATVWSWIFLRPHGAPAEWCAAIEVATGVPKSELRPDIFPPSEHRKITPREPRPRELKGTDAHSPSVPASSEEECGA